jgi:hypothetical protein
VSTRLTARVVFRYTLAALLVLASLAPVILTSPILGELNLAYSVAIWLLFIALLVRRPPSVVVASAVVLGLALTLQPIPNWLSVSNDGDIRIRLIGLAVLKDAAPVVATLWIFNLVALLGVAGLLRKPDASARR